MSSSRRRSYTEDYKREAAHLVIDTGRSIAAVAHEINVGPQTLGNWVRQEKERLHGDGKSTGPFEERAVRVRHGCGGKCSRRAAGGQRVLGKSEAFFASKPRKQNGSS